MLKTYFNSYVLLGMQKKQFFKYIIELLEVAQPASPKFKQSCESVLYIRREDGIDAFHLYLSQYFL